MKRILLAALLAISALYSQAQTLKGVVKDAQTALPIPGATITINKQTIVADDNGFFSATIHPGISFIHISSVGYAEKEVPVKHNSGTLLILLEPANYSLNEVQVTGWSTGKKDNQLTEAQSVGILTRKDLLRTNHLFLENAMNTIPGVFMQSRTISGGQRIIIRGYGNNTNFNGQGYQVLVNNIPITDATGTTIMDDIDFTTLGKVEVFKGPQSSLYGAGIAGVVHLYTLKPEPNQTRIVEENILGSYGLWRNNTRIEAASNNSAIVFNYGHQSYNGFRDHSDAQKNFATFNGDFFIGERQTISAYFSYNHSNEAIPGELDSTRFYNRESWSDPAYVTNDARVRLESFRAGLTDNYRISPHFTNQTTLFTTGYHIYQPFARGLNSNQVFTFGGRTGFVYEGTAGQTDINGIAGAQFQKTTSFNKGYNLTNGILGGIRSDLQNYSTTYNLFTEWKFSFPKKVVFTAGGSFNYLEYHIADMLTNSANPTHADQSGYKRFKPVFTPRVALLKVWNDAISIYGDVSAGYTPPTTSTVIISAIGETNKELKPEHGIQYEVGTKGSLLNKKISYQLALFNLNVTNKIVGLTVPASGTTPQYTRYTNAGKQQNLGAELSVNYTAIKNPNNAVTLLRPFASYTYSYFRYRDFDNGGNKDFSDNKVAGVAPHMVNIGVDVETKPGLYLYATYQYVDKVPYTFDNLHYAKAYSLLSGKVGYRNNLGEHFSIDAFAGADNLLGNTYYSFLFLSANLSTQQDPHFIPGSYKATVYGGLRLAYRF